jgi:hypothetical protein
MASKALGKDRRVRPGGRSSGLSPSVRPFDRPDAPNSHGSALAVAGDLKPGPVPESPTIPSHSPSGGVTSNAGCGAIFCAPFGPRVVIRNGEPIAEYERLD